MIAGSGVRSRKKAEELLLTNSNQARQMDHQGEVGQGHLIGINKQLPSPFFLSRAVRLISHAAWEVQLERERKFIALANR